MRFLVAGAGGVGGYFGGLLAHGGHQVTFLARGAHLAALRDRGLAIHSVHGDFVVRPADATDDVSLQRGLDYVLVATKHFDLEGVAPRLAPAVGPGTTVVPLINGVDAHEVLSRWLPAGQVVGGTSSIVSRIESPGVVSQESRMQRIVVGEPAGGTSDRLTRLVAALTELGVEASQASDIHQALWSKFVFIVSFGGVSALARANAGELRAEPHARGLVIEAMREIEAVGRARGVKLPGDVVEQSMRLIDGLEPEATSSMQRDVAAGRRFELEAFSGTVVRLAAECAVDVPVHRAIYALLKPALTRAESAV